MATYIHARVADGIRGRQEKIRDLVTDLLCKLLNINKKIIENFIWMIFGLFSDIGLDGWRGRDA
ncbi:hypothetical protein [Paraburkholderia sp. D1E]|uniref:hypothetical protein n=1 Tax=Paraburkholderia sp. D1E TaxID=3461398 RepID=UPI0040465698